MKASDNNGYFNHRVSDMYNEMNKGYMSYQIPYSLPMMPLYGYDNSEDLDKDCEYMKSMYPSMARQIQKEVDEECDKLEYDGSCMFDEFPDKVHLGMIVDRIYRRMNKEELNAQAMERDRCRDGRCNPSRRNDSLHDLIEIILFNEMHHRRRRHRSRKRWF